MIATRESCDGAADLGRASIGGSIDLTVPLENRCLLRDVAEALEGLARVMDAQSRLKGVSELEALVRVKFEVRHANNLITAACTRHGIDLQPTKSGGA